MQQLPGFSLICGFSQYVVLRRLKPIAVIFRFENGRSKSPSFSRQTSICNMRGLNPGQLTVRNRLTRLIARCRCYDAWSTFA